MDLYEAYQQHRDKFEILAFHDHRVKDFAELDEKLKLVIRGPFVGKSLPFPVLLEFLEFEKLTEDTSKLTMHVVYKSVAHRDQLLKLPFAQGINMAHNRIQDIVSKLK